MQGAEEGSRALDVLAYLGERQDLLFFVAVEHHFCQQDTVTFESAVGLSKAKSIPDAGMQRLSVRRRILAVLREYLDFIWRFIHINVYLA